MQLKSDVARWLPFSLGERFHRERLVDCYSEHRAIFSAYTRACAANRKKH